jgi:hypothetical protein
VQCYKSGVQEYLIAEPSVSCSGSTYAKLRNIAIAACVLYGIGIPLLFAWLLLRHR